MDPYRKFNIVPESKGPEYRLKKRLTALRRFLVYVSTERRSILSLPLRTRIRAWRMGFTSLSYTLYGLEEKDPGDYLRDFPDMNYRMDHPGAATIGDKLNFARNMRSIGIAVPRSLAILDRGLMLPTGPDDAGGEVKKGLPALLEHYRRVVVKPIFRGAGMGVCFVCAGKSGYSLNGAAVAAEELWAFLSRLRYSYISEYVHQADYAEKLFKPVTNTLRVLTLWDRKQNEPFIAAAAHRIGTKRSFPIDNFHGGTGGLSAGIDPETGRLGPGVSLGPSGQRIRHDRHPETDAQISGVRIPGWKETTSQILRAAVHFSVTPYVGWDLVITKSGCCFLEGNSPPGAVVWQVHKPLLADARIRRFYADCDML